MFDTALKFIPGETVRDEQSISPNSVEGDFHNPLTSRCETFDGQKLLATFSFLTNNRLSLVYVFPKKVTLLITAKQNVQYQPAASLRYSTTQFVVVSLCCVSLRHEIYCGVLFLSRV